MLDKLISLCDTKPEVTVYITFLYNENKSAAENCIEIVTTSEKLTTMTIDNPWIKAWSWPQSLTYCLPN